MVPAGGRSRRMGAPNKLLLDLGNRSVLEWVVTSALEAALDEVIVVTGAGGDEVSERMAGYAVRVVHNAAYDEGMASSIRVGLQAADAEAEGIGILPGDMPFVRSGTVARLAASLRPGTIVVPYHDGRAGHPVFFAASFRNELLDIQGDAGARSVLERCAEAVVEIETDDAGVLRDIDTEDDYKKARSADIQDEAMTKRTRQP